MTPSASRRLAWTAVGLSASFLVVHMLLGRVADTAFTSTTDSVLVAGLAFSTFAFAIPGALIVGRQAGNTIGWLLLAIPLAVTLAFFVGDYATYGIVTRPGSLPAARFAAWVDRWSVVPTLSLFIPLFLLFPDGRIPSPSWRPALWLAVGAPAVTTVAFAITPGPMTGAFADLSRAHVTNPLGLDPLKGVVDAMTGIGGVATLVAAVLAAVSLFFRFRSRRGDEREQVKWLAFVGVAFFVQFAIAMVGVIVSSDNDSVGNVMFPVMVFTLILGIPGACAVAVLKYRLYSIDLVINKTLVYGAMAAFITAVYVAVVVGIGRAIGSDRNLALSIVATAVVAVGFQPVRERVQRLANRLVYGKRATPYEVLSQFSGGMSHAVATEDLLPGMARIVAEGTGAARADIWLRVGPELVREASWPPANGRVRSVVTVPEEGAELRVGDADLTVAVRHQGELLGAVGVRKSPGEAVTPGETKLLEDLASQAGLVLRNVRLIEELKTSRQRLVTAQDEERRRLERDLHDGAQQRIVAIALALRMARGLVPADTPDLGDRIDQAAQEIGTALSELREFARGIHPAILTERGLIPALQSLVERSSVPARLEGGPLDRFPAAIEATAYFVVSEALANAAKYSEATAVTVRVAHEDGVLAVDVEDDGVGDADPSRGSGLRGLGDRVAVVDGILEIDSPPGQGTRLRVRIPIPMMAEATT